MLANGWVLWLIVALVLGVIEVLTVNLTFLMLAIGAFCAASVSVVSGNNMVFSVMVFVAASLLLLLILRPPLLRKLHTTPDTSALSNVDRLPGQPCIVIQPVDSRSGLVQLDGDIWSARADGQTEYAINERLFVDRVEGARVVVTHKLPSISL